jgi:hypothetical protein
MQNVLLHLLFKDILWQLHLFYFNSADVCAYLASANNTTLRQALLHPNTFFSAHLYCNKRPMNLTVRAEAVGIVL